MAVRERHFDYIVVGGGVMGVSTSLALQKKWSNAKILLIEGEDTVTASKGITKIIRTPYQDAEYASLAAEAKIQWEKSLPYCGFYRKTGWVQEVCKAEYKPFHDEERVINTDELAQIVGSRVPSKLDDGKELWFNEDIGIANAAHAVEAAAKDAAARGVQREHWDASRLVIENGMCRGVQRSDGAIFTANTVIVATGPWTPAFLENSGIAIQRDYFKVTAVGVATLSLTEDEYARFETMPILATDEGEIMPPDAEQRVLQITSTHFFPINHPADLQREYQSEILARHRYLLGKMIPEMTERALEITLYPELVMPDRDPLVDAVPNVEGVHLAVGGGYHCYKFLPIFGTEVVKHLEGNRSYISRKWIWKRDIKGDI